MNENLLQAAKHCYRLKDSQSDPVNYYTSEYRLEWKLLKKCKTIIFFKDHHSVFSNCNSVLLYNDLGSIELLIDEFSTGIVFDLDSTIEYDEYFNCTVLYDLHFSFDDLLLAQELFQDMKGYSFEITIYECT